MANNIPVELLEKGDKLYKRYTEPMGNTTLKRKGINVYTFLSLEEFEYGTTNSGSERSKGFRLRITYNGQERTLYSTRGFSHLHPKPLRNPLQDDESLAKAIARAAAINAEEKAKFKARRAALALAAKKAKG